MDIQNFLAELEGRGFNFQDKSYTEFGFNDEVLNMVYEMYCVGQQAQKVAVPEWIKCSERLPELKGVWRTSLPLYVQIEGFGISLAYPCKWMDEPFCWVPANIKCNSDLEYAPVNDKNQLIGVTHWMPPPTTPKEKAMIKAQEQ